MRIAYQGEPGAYSEAAALRFSPQRRDAAVRELRGCLRRCRQRQDDARDSADRELDRRKHPSQLRPVARARAAGGRRGAAAGFAQSARVSRNEAGGHQEGVLASPGTRAVRGLSVEPEGRRDRGDVRHGRQREDDSRQAAEGRRRHRVGARGGGLRPAVARRRHSGFQREHHAVHPDQQGGRPIRRRPTRR